MNCASIRELILESVDGGLAEADERVVAGHVAACAECRGFQEIQRRLDVVLAAQLGAVRPAAEFDRRLWARIRAEGNNEADTVDGQRREAEAEREDWLTGWGRQFRRAGWLGMLDGAGLAAVLVVSGVGLVRVLAGGAWLKVPWAQDMDPRLIPAVAVAALALAAGGAVAAKVRNLDYGWDSR